MDAGAGQSMAYAMTAMGDHVYIGGHTEGDLTISSGSGVETRYPDLDAAHKDLYIVKLDRSGDPKKVSLIDGDASGSSNVVRLSTRAARALALLCKV